GLEPLDERDVRLPASRRLETRAAFLDPAVPRTDVLADVAAVDLGAQLGAVRIGDRVRALRPVREAAVGVQHAWLVERAGRTGLDAERAGTAVGVERRSRLELGLGDQRPQHDP